MKAEPMTTAEREAFGRQLAIELLCDEVTEIARKCKPGNVENCKARIETIKAVVEVIEAGGPLP